MTADQRQLIYDAIMRGVPQPHNDQPMKALLAKLTWEEIARFEPIVDEMCFASFRAGQRFSGRRSCEEIISLGERRDA